jgi:hypothetical protein
MGIGLSFENKTQNAQERFQAKWTPVRVKKTRQPKPAPRFQPRRFEPLPAMSSISRGARRQGSRLAACQKRLVIRQKEPLESAAFINNGRLITASPRKNLAQARAEIFLRRGRA